MNRHLRHKHHKDHPTLQSDFKQLLEINKLANLYQLEDSSCDISFLVDVIACKSRLQAREYI